ncbi:helix-turn-helix transcriptional regulator [Actimicrobium sp. CCI2.3]|uniref:helix-turn-helix transcriptional regulator n=1 Tax=Actimicrobium sp. CCI2.3 TaxID=3048616 RepID=UPI002AB476D8|nr:helix-turn-helix transcriptional regulator [Actimicrobium sp. CCI2.3]MDY7575469.1 helix-turn-helix transcriptional regulator [Actimicrobium sp. CCI2.3]MEB0024042.1 helix-turn-helix transcriptional regulator [Actimicrobium sp. CCI2.3]
MTTEKIITQLITRRRELKITQDELARRAGVNRRTIVAIEAGTSDVGLRRLLRILTAMDMSVTLTLGAGRPTEAELTSIFRDDND